MVCPPSEGLVSPCLPLSPFLFPFVGWCVRLPEGLVSPCLPVSPFLFPFVGWCVRLPEGLVSPCLSLSPLVFPCLPCLPCTHSCFVLSPLSPFVSPCLPVGCLLSPLSPFLFPFLFPFVGWCVRLPEGLVSPCLPFVSPCLPSCFPSSALLVVLNAFFRCPPWCWMVCPPSRRSCLPLSPIVPLLVSPCWMVCPPCRGSSLPLSPIVPFLFPLVGWYVRLSEGLVSFCLPFCSFLFPFVGFSLCLPWCPFLFSLVGWCVRLADVLPPIAPIVSHCLRARVPVLDGASAFSTSSLSLLSPIVSSTCVPVLDGVSAFPRSCLPVYPCLPLSPHMCACMFWMVCSPSRGLVSPCRLPSRGLVYPCLPLNQLSPIVSAHACLCLMVRPPSRRLVSPFCLPLSLPTCVPVMVCLPDGVSAFSRSCLPLSLLVSPCLPLSPHNIRLCWMACPPSQGLISPCRLPLSPTSLLVSLSWMVCPPFRGLVSLVSTCPPLFPILSHCLPTCVPVEVLSPLLSHCLPLSAHTCACVGWCVFSTSCLPVLSPICLRTCVPVLDGASALACPPSRVVSSCLPVLDGVSAFPRSCFPFSPISLLVSLCWMVCPPSRRLVSPCLSLSPHMCACVGRCVPLPKVLSPLVSHCFPTCVPVTFCVGWCVRLPAVLSPPSLPVSPFLFPCV